MNVRGDIHLERNPRFVIVKKRNRVNRQDRRRAAMFSRTRTRTQAEKHEDYTNGGKEQVELVDGRQWRRE